MWPYTCIPRNLLTRDTFITDLNPSLNDSYRNYTETIPVYVFWSIRGMKLNDLRLICVVLYHVINRHLQTISIINVHPFNYWIHSIVIYQKWVGFKISKVFSTSAWTHKSHKQFVMLVSLYMTYTNHFYGLNWIIAHSNDGDGINGISSIKYLNHLPNKWIC